MVADLNEWARLISKYLLADGTFYIVEGHPFANLIDGSRDLPLQVDYPYFAERAVSLEGASPGYDFDHEFKNDRSYEWSHPLSRIINALLAHDLRLELIHEYPFTFFPIHPRMYLGDDNYWYFDDDSVAYR